MMRSIPGSPPPPKRRSPACRTRGLVGLLGAGCMVLQGCSQLEGTQRPFQGSPAPEIAAITTSPTVMVAPVGGPPPQVGRVLAELVADSLRERDVLAVTRNPAPGSMLLTGHAEMVPEGKDHALLKVAWSLTQADGLTTGTFRSQQTVPIIPGEDPYQRLSASAMMPFASRVAFQAADLVVNPPKPVQVASGTDVAAAPSADAAPDAAQPDGTVTNGTSMPAPPPPVAAAATPEKLEKTAKAAPKTPAAKQAPAAETAPIKLAAAEAAKPPPAEPAPPAKAANPAETEAATEPTQPAEAGKPAPTRLAAAEPTPDSETAPHANAKPAEAPARPDQKPEQAATGAAPEAADLQDASLKAAMSRGEARRAERNEKAEAKAAPAETGQGGGAQPDTVRVASAAPAAGGLIATDAALATGQAERPAGTPPPTAKTESPAPPMQSGTAQAVPDEVAASLASAEAKPVAPPAADKPASHKAPAEPTPTPPAPQSAAPQRMAAAEPAPPPVAASASAAASTIGGYVPGPGPAGQAAATKTDTTKTDTTKTDTTKAATTPAPAANPAPEADQGNKVAQAAAERPAPDAKSAVASPAAPAIAKAEAPASSPPASPPPVTAARPEPTPPTPAPVAPAIAKAEAPASPPPTSPPPVAAARAEPAPPAPASVAPPAAPASQPERVAALPAAAPPAPRGPINEVLVSPVRGAPGNGNDALTGAIRQALGRSGLKVTDYAGRQTAVLHGSVSVSQTGPTVDDVTIEWAVYDSAGGFLGTVTQRNQLPRGLVEGRWNDTAGMAAAGAVAGIRRLLAQARPAGAG